MSNKRDFSQFCFQVGGNNVGIFIHSVEIDSAAYQVKLSLT